MPPKRKTRTASRCKPVLANITNKLDIIDSKEKQRRAFLIDDFRRNVALRMEMIQEEERQLEASLWKSYQIFRQQLEPFQNITVLQLLECCDVDSVPKPLPQASKRDKKIPATTDQDEAAAGLCGGETGELPATTTQNTELTTTSTSANTAQSGTSDATETYVKCDSAEDKTTQSESCAGSPKETTCSNAGEPDPPGIFAVPEPVASKAPRMSDISAIIAEASKASKAAAAKPKKKKAQHCTPAVPSSATRSSSRLRRADGPPGHLAPPSTGRAPRAKCGESGMLVTPAGQRIPTRKGSQLLVTPKFDPRLPLPPNTQLRRLLPREVPMSITGSPLSLSPDKPKLKAIMGEFLETLEREVPSLDHKDIRQFHSVLQRHLDHKH